MSSNTTGKNHDLDEEDDQEDIMLHPDEAEEEIIQAEDEDAPMDSDGDDEETMPDFVPQTDDSSAIFGLHRDSIFCIAQHPVHPEIIATGGGDDVGYIFESAPSERPVLPASYESNPQSTERKSLPALWKLEGHTDSLNSITFTRPNGEYVVSAGLDGQVRAWQGDSAGHQWRFVGSVQEVEEVNWLSPCPHPQHPNTVALGAGDGSVWVYTIDATQTEQPLAIVQAFYLHTESCTAGSWTPDGRLLATVSEDASLHVWDVFGDAAAMGVPQAQGSQTLVSLTAQDERFKVEQGLFSIAISPNGALAAVGGGEGQIRIVGLPILTSDLGHGKETSATVQGRPSKGSGAKASTSSLAGQIVASLQTQSDNIETLSFSQPPLTLLSSGSVDGSIALFDVAHRFAVRRHIDDAHDGQAVIQVQFASSAAAGHVEEWTLTSCGNDGIIRRWDARGGNAASQQGLIREYKGHKGGGEGGGILAFVQSGKNGRIVTAGDE